jgi:hypothetical protein
MRCDDAGGLAGGDEGADACDVEFGGAVDGAPSEPLGGGGGGGLDDAEGVQIFEGAGEVGEGGGALLWSKA